ncbi:TPA: ABC transporter ATP-binding protein [Streptococcus suis]|uniref:ABC transporter ATP-binding protein n=1 Tax=Streptococcus suis TaxID=1307 RepID=UPI000418043D|nr:ABC transporter ATP-binding protein [Streptococcus suis]HEM5209880.1 ABC transporter ATP-binding protein [Streptococcus suis]
MKVQTRKYSTLAIIGRSIFQYLKISGAMALVEHVVAAGNAFLLFLEILLLEQFFDVVMEIDINQASSVPLLSSLGNLTIVIISQQILNGIDKYLLSYNSYKNVGKFMAELMLKLDKISPVCFEDSRFLDNLDQVKRCIEYESYGYFSSNCIRLLTYYGVFFVSISFHFFHLSPIIPVVILLSFIPALLGHFVQVKFFTNLEEESAPLRRQFSYYRDAIVAQANFKETRMLGAYVYFKKLFKDSLLLLTQKYWEVELKVVALRFLLDLVSFVGFTISTIILFNSALDKQISLATFIAVFGALSQLFSMSDELISTYVSEASESLGKIKTYFKILDWEEVDGKIEQLDFSKGIKATHVNFTYPTNDTESIRDLNIYLSEKETLAIVGENGSGKTTLVRLLLGLYRPNSGKVQVGGLDTRTTQPRAIYDGFSAVFQNFMRYKMTLFENVLISDTWQEKKNSIRVEEVLAAVHVKHEEIGLNNMLSTEFGGIDLSGGQWQRIAIARGLYRFNDVVVLDEPTAAIDPIEEERLYAHFRELTRYKTAIFITHRLASAKFADRIVVMDKGQIIEIGTHNQLIQLQGKYAKMWQEQAKWYRRN